MCGIYLTNIPYEQAVVKQKLESISYRGPDYTGITKADNITLGHLRLSILDLDARSHQPMVFKNLHIVFNGEIYNYKEIRSKLIRLGYQFKTESDTEVLLIGFYEWQEKLLDRINGMFAFSIYNTSTNTVFSARDRLGVKPFYYYFKDNKLEICSQIRPLLKGKTIDANAISMYLDCKFIPSPYTIVEEVKKLPPGNFMVIDLANNTKNITEYWNLKVRKVRKDISYEQAKEQLHELLIDAVKIRLQSDVPIGSFLSGGIDSAMVSAIAAKISPTPINTFTIGFDDKEFDESNVAEQFAKIIKSNHRTTFCKIQDIENLIPKIKEVYDEPFADSSALPSLLLNSITKQYATVALSGDGGDESFMGYTHFDSLAKHEPIMNLPYFLRKFLSHSYFLSIIGQNNKRVKNALLTKKKYDFIENIFSRRGILLVEKKQKWMKYYQDYKILSKNFLQKAADLNIKLWLENDSNVKVDRASMAYSVEVRSPFLDYRIIEFARSLPVSFRFEKGNQKRILKDILEEYIPREVFTQPKKGFAVPIGEWMRNELKTEFTNALNDEFLMRIPNLNVKKFKILFERHMSRKEDNTENIWKVYILSQWYEEFDKINQDV